MCRNIVKSRDTNIDVLASIERLNIIGYAVCLSCLPSALTIPAFRVRSFDHRGTGQRIDFKAPLTLIVGYNGYGKTVSYSAYFVNDGKLMK